MVSTVQVDKIKHASKKEIPVVRRPTWKRYPYVIIKEVGLVTYED